MCGLSFSKFRYSDILVSRMVKVNVPGARFTPMSRSPTSAVAAREVAQLYLNRPKPPAGLPIAPWALKGYQW